MQNIRDLEQHDHQPMEIKETGNESAVFGEVNFSLEQVKEIYLLELRGLKNGV